MLAAQKASRMEALLRLLLSLQRDHWLTADGTLRFAEISQSACAAPSSTHGQGLFAARALDAGDIAAFYPVCALGDSKKRFEDERSTVNFGGVGHKPYRVALPASPGLVAWGADDWDYSDSG